MIKKTGSFMLAVFLITCMMTACAQEKDVETKETEIADMEDSGNGQEADDDTDRETEEAATEVPESSISEDVSAEVPESSISEDSQSDSWKQQFGEDCISEQVFEVELSEYNGKVCFVPYAPSNDGQDFHVQIIQDGEVLAELPGYVPETLSGETFKSLDAVSFFDVNYDGGTDIVLIETYGDKSFAAVYYGYADDAEEYEQYFWSEEALSENITRQAESLTIPGIREFLADGKKNGEFSGYQEAYDAVGRLKELELEEDRTYDLTYSLLYVDEDEVPELAAGVNGYYVSLYTYRDGKVFTLMDQWSYGAMGNAGYEYAPRKNNLRNYNADYAGAVMYTTYMSVSDRHTLEITAQIKTVNFDDVNENGVPDEDEMGSFERYGVNYIDGRTASIEECASYDAGDYEMICGSMSLEELKAYLH